MIFWEKNVFWWLLKLKGKNDAFIKAQNSNNEKNDAFPLQKAVWSNLIERRVSW